jgi:hypothetical protein
MKKIIALAVAGAFVAPVYAAEVTVGGAMEFALKNVDGSSDSMTDGGNELIVTASEEVNGLTVTAGIVLGLDGNETDEPNGNDVFTSGSYISVAGGFGTFTVGDTSGGLDAYGDYTDVSPAGAGFDADGGDSAASLALPAMGAVSITVGWSPEGGGSYTRDDETTSDSGVDSDHTSIGAAYAFNGGQFYAGTQEAGDITTSAYGVKYSSMGLMLALEAGSIEEGADNDDLRGFAATYTLGDVVLGVESQKEDDEDGTTEQDETAVFVEYNLGGNVDIYAVSVNDDVAQTDTNYVGIEYNF